MHQDKEEEQLAKFRTIVPNATIETLRTFHDCINTEAVSKVAFPYSLLTSALSYFVIPKKYGINRYYISATFGIAMFFVSRLLYVPICYQKAIYSTTEQDDQPLKRRNKMLYEPHKQVTEDTYLAPIDSVTETQDWNNFDTGFDSTLHEFNDTIDDMQEEFTSEKKKEGTKRVTYDDLWSQHKQQTVDTQYRRFPNRRFNTMPIQSQQKDPDEIDKFTIPETEDEKNIW